jgi:16S rRNA C967 or C1407 C5-methylase (RsmB/RsmF family)
MQTKLDKNFLEKLEKIYTKDELRIINKWFNTKKRATIFRINSLKTNDDEIFKILKEKKLEIEKIPYLTNAYKLKNWKEKDLWNLNIFKEWKIYLQWITSQIPVELINIPENIENFKVLDLTAAPWWKTSQISTKLWNKWEIIANEKNTIRFEKLTFTIKRQWNTNVKLYKNDANNLKNIFPKNYFDVIIADLPCSAEWRINLTKEKSYAYLKKTWLNKKNYKIQQEILKNNIWLLKKNWQLIYSTCTLDPRENEGIVHYLLSNFPELELQDISNFFTQKWLKEISKVWIKSFEKLIFKKEIINSYRILPSIDTEWFFIAKFIKK